MRTWGRWANTQLMLLASFVLEPSANAAPPKATRPDHEHIGRQLHYEAASRARRQRSTKPEPRRPSREGDAVKLPAMRHPTVHAKPRSYRGASVGWAVDLTSPRVEDRRRRYDPSTPPPPFGAKLDTGTRFVFDVYIAGNPAGTAEAFVGETKADPRGSPPDGRPLKKLFGRATTGGVVSMLATVTDEMTSWVDAETGAPVLNQNVITRTGLMAPYTRRETSTIFEGRGSIRIVDRRDERVRKVSKRVPENTLDAMGAMAWVRSLRLAPGEQASAHALDGSRLMRIDVINRGNQPLRPMPSLGTALGLGDHNLELIEGTVRRVTRHKAPVPDSRVASFRAWISNDDRRIILALESDMWLGIIRIVLSRYDGPSAVLAPSEVSPTTNNGTPKRPTANTTRQTTSADDASTGATGPR